MTAEQVLAAYPDCPVAVAWVELFVCQPTGDGKSSWDVMMEVCPPLSIEEVFDFVHQCALEEAHESPEENLRQKAAIAYEQMKTPAYRNYLAAKMGLV